ncbi:MAG TPA: hypothetical protein VHT02_00720, partial [Methylocella sp.]|nr:hypothetical protein [Methylocella sp.]
EVYAAGEKIANWQIADQVVAGKAALTQFGTYDFQRDKAPNTFFNKYINAANYAVAVYMAGTGYAKWFSVAVAQTWGLFTSSTKFDDNARYWTEKGWDDADRGDWKTK